MGKNDRNTSADRRKYKHLDVYDPYQRKPLTSVIGSSLKNIVVMIKE